MTGTERQIESYREGVADAAALLARELASARGAERDLARRARACRRRLDGMTAALSAKREVASEIERVPLLGAFLGRRKRIEADRLEASVRDLEAELSQIAGEGRRARCRIAEMDGLAGALSAASDMARTSGGLPPSIADSGEAAGNRASALRRRTGPSAREVVNVARELVLVASRWRSIRTLARERASMRTSPPLPPPSARTAGGTGPGAAAGVPVSGRIYLPIPVSMRHAAARAGAAYDPEAPAGSRMYVPVDGDLTPFERMLPLSFRATPPRLTFPPIRAGAAGQSIWGLFDRHTWDHIRASAYERTGRRCMLCGKMSGSLRSRLFPESAGRVGPVECHEVWDWKVPDPADGVGIQRLRALLVVCFECHAVFHEGLMTAAARKVGLLDEVERFIETRRLLLTRMSPEQLRDSLDRTDAQWTAHSDIRQWIIDLSHLAAQDFMAHAAPVLVEKNPAGVPPERIAGISFVTDGGRTFAARRPLEVLAASAGPGPARQMRRAG